MGLNMGYPGAMEVSKSPREHGFPNILGSANRSCFWTEHVPAGVILNSWVTFYRRRTTTNPEWKDDVFCIHDFIFVGVSYNIKYLIVIHCSCQFVVGQVDCLHAPSCALRGALVVNLGMAFLVFRNLKAPGIPGNCGENMTRIKPFGCSVPDTWGMGIPFSWPWHDLKWWGKWSWKPGHFSVTFSLSHVNLWGL